MDTDDKKRRETLARQIRELRGQPGWQALESELAAIRDALDRKILTTSLAHVDNALRYTRADLEREIRRVISNFIELPDDLVARLE
jgi:hypothetical protein